MGRADYAEKPEIQNGTVARPQGQSADPEALAQAKSGQPERPLSFAQQRLWFLEQMEPGSVAYNMPLAARLTGALNFAAFEQALNAVIARHESLRTRFVSVDGHPVQIIDSDPGLKLRIEDLSLLSFQEKERRLKERIRAEINAPFDIGKERLVRVLLLRLSQQEHALVLTMHHIVSDEWSLNIFFKELGVFYEEFATGERVELPELPIQYAEFALWQRERLNGAELEKQLGFWRGRLKDAPVLELPTDFPRRQTVSCRGQTLTRFLSKEMETSLRQLARREESTLFMVLMAAFNGLLYRHTQQQDIIVGSPIAGRTQMELEGLIGFFVNILPFRTELSGNDSFKSLLRQVRGVTLAAYSHQDVPFEKIVEELHPERSAGHLPFARVLFMLQNSSFEKMRWRSGTRDSLLDIQFLEAQTETSKFELSVTVQETSLGLAVRAEYNSGLFAETTIERLLQHFEILLQGIITDPNRRLSELPLLSDAESKQLLVEWNSTASEYPRNKSIHQIFEEHATRTPDAIAVSFGSRSITYGALNASANQIARYLREYRASPGALVGLCIEPSVEMVIGMLGILKAGGAYVPLDPSYPSERLAFMLRDTRTPVVLTQQALLYRIPGDFANVVCLDSDWELLARCSSANLENCVSATELAYVMYTSGSTGQPKGVKVRHQGVTRLVVNTNYIQLDRTDRIGQVSNISFDAATFEIWGALLNGARLVGIASDVAISPKEFARELKEEGITAIFLTSALFTQIVNEAPDAFQSLRTVIAGGEALDPHSVHAVLRSRPPQRLLNGYGPTENTSFTCCHEIQHLPDDATNVPIGRPISNTQVYILDSALNPVPIGVPGELYAAGEGLADGYWNRPELTAEKFIPNPFVRHSSHEPRPSTHLYRTGDLARYLPNGEIEFLGRIDGQVKIRGFRIELEEIESTLRSHPAIRDCAVAVLGSGAGEKRLVGYFVPRGELKPTANDLRVFLKKTLPEYMVPSAFVAIDALPLSPNGKLDRGALPEPGAGLGQSDSYQHPRDDIEHRLANIWEEVLDVRPIGVRDKFFDLGGHSLLAVRLVSRIEQEFARKFRVASVFQSPTIEELAGLIREEVKEAEAKSSIVEIQGKGERPALFLVHGAGGGMFWGYANLSRHLGPSQPVFAFRSRGLDGQQEFSSIEEMAAHYVSDLRERQPRGPYYLGGYCFGGNVAYQMARQLTESGEEVALLALMNCAPPNSAYTRVSLTPSWCLRLARNLLYWAAYVRELNPPHRREFARWKWHRLKQWLRGTQNGSGQVDVGNLVDLSLFPGEERTVWEAHIKALLKYCPEPYEGKVHLFRSPGHPVLCSFDPDYGWRAFAKGGIVTSIVSGAHEKILEEPCVRAIATQLAKFLNPQNLPKALGVRSAQVFESSVEVPIHPSQERTKRIQENDLAYWKKQLAGAPSLLDLPTDRSRPAVQSGGTGVESRQIPKTLVASSQEDDAVTTLASIFVLLRRYTAQDDLLVAASSAGKGDSDRTVLRISIGDNPSVSDLLRRVRQAGEQAAGHSSVSFKRLIQELCPNPDSSYHPLCQVAFSVSGQAGFEGPDAKFDLHFQISNASPHALTVRYAKDLFEAETIQRLLAQWEAVLENIIEHPGRRVSELVILPPEEQNLLLVEWNNTRKDYPREKTLFQLFEEQALRTPDAEALVCGDTRLTYSQLLIRANAVARQLQALGVRPESLVGICLDRSWEMIAGILGTLKAGGAYVPMDPAYPKDRIAFMLDDAKAGVLLAQRKQLDSLPKTGSEILCLDEFDWTNHGPGADQSRDQSLISNHQSPLAYVIYTSGSTGKPKGVAIDHRNAVAFVSWAKEVFTPEELSGVLFSTSICFDLSIFEMFVPLCCGGKVILAENALALRSVSAASEVKLINTVPSAIRELLRIKGVPESVRVINLAGEPLATSLVNEIYGQTAVQKVYDLYGPTETTTYSTFTVRKPDEPPSIGRPLSNEQVYLLDSHMQLVPIGVPGDLYIGGDGVARGYLNRPELTAEKFIANPFALPSRGNNAANRLYKTGDLARWRADGRLEFLGRRDHQVKVRGFRIELGEIETVLKKQPGVHEAVVLAREDQPGIKRLVAYLATGSCSSGATNAEKLREALKFALPAYMVPSAFVFLETLPLTPNGKVDRNALPPPFEDRSSISHDFVPPSSPIEHQLVAIWCDVLHMKEIGVRDNFFDLGGNSLVAVQVISRIRESFNVDLPTSTLFESPTVSALAQRLSTSSQASKEHAIPLEPISREGNLPVSFVQERLWFLDEIRAESHAYNVPIAFRLKGGLDVGAFQKAFDYLVMRHESLRTTFQMADGNLRQSISARASLPIAFVDLRDREATSQANFETCIQQLVNAEAQKRFDLVEGPLVRARLFCLGETEHILVLVMHHTISDGWSLGIFFREFEAVYRAIAKGEPIPPLPPLQVQYADFAAWRRKTLQGEFLDAELNYWKKKLAGAPAAIALPSDRMRNGTLAANGGYVTVRFPESIADAVLKFGRQDGMTPFIVVMAALAITLRKWTGQDDMVIGTVVAGRNRRELENVIGCFMNFLPLRIPIQGTETGREILARVREVAVEAQNHQECPFEKIVEAINPERNLNRNPLYNVALLFQNFPLDFMLGGPLSAEPFPALLDTALLDMRFEAEQTAQGFSLLCEYNTELFERATIERLMVAYGETLETLVRAPDTVFNGFAAVAATDTPAMVVDKEPVPPAHEYDTSSDKSAQQNIAIAGTFTTEPLADPLRYWIERLEIPAATEFAPYNQAFQQLLDPASLFNTNKRGLNVILVRFEDWCGAERDLKREPNSNSLENAKRNLHEFVAALKKASARNAVPHLVCICAPSTCSPIAGHELELETLLAAELDALAGVHILTSAELARLYPVPDYYDASGDELGHVPYTPQFFTALATGIARKFHTLNRPAYKVIVLDLDQTLWSGVCGEDGANGICLDEPRVVLQKFMRAQQEAGMLLCICSKNNEEDAYQVFEQRLDMPLRREHFAGWRLNWNPKSENLKSLAQELQLGLDSFIFIDDNPVECAEVQANCPEVLTLLLPDDPALIPQFLDHCWVFDHLKLTAEDRNRAEMYQQNQQREQLRSRSVSLDDFLAGLNLKIQIEPMSGEQLPRVAQLTQRTNQFNCTSFRRSETDIRQLLDRSEVLTVSVSDRFGDYGLTGVIISYSKGNALNVETFLLSCRVLGRGVEHQMLARLGKIARQRNLEWVDFHFNPSPKNKPAFDFLQSLGEQFRQPLNGGYVFRFPAVFASEVVFRAPNNNSSATSNPEQAIRNMQHITLNAQHPRANAPLYRRIALELNDPPKILANIESKTLIRQSGGTNYVPPRSKLEKQLCEIWQKHLHLDRVGVTDNFFEIGGHSLLAVRLFAEINHVTGKKLPLVTIFQSPTIEQLANGLSKDKAELSESLLTPIQPQGSKPPLILVHGAGGDILWGYANLSAHMPDDQPIYGIKSCGQAGREEFTRIEEMAACYVRELRAFQPHGPYYLGGYCFGGNVAYEMARQLRANGENVALLALLDSAPANAGYEKIHWWNPAYGVRFLRNLYHWLSDFAEQSAKERRRFITRKIRSFARKLRRRGGPRTVDLESVIDISHFPENELRLWQVHLQALMRHIQQPFPGDILLLRTRGQPLLCSLEEDFCWRKLATGGVQVIEIPGSHENIFMEPNIQTLAKELAFALAQSQKKSSQAATFNSESFRANLPTNEL